MELSFISDFNTALDYLTDTTAINPVISKHFT